MTFAVRTEGDPARASGAVLAAVQAVDRAVPVFDMQTQEAVIDAALRQERLFAYAAAGFAGFALFVACLGIYGSLSYAVARRTPEIGLRVALGATRSSVMMMVLRESIMPVLFGAVAGVAGAATATRLIASMMFGVETSDAPTFAACVAALVVSALAAAWGPCRRAARLDPVVALRAE